MTKQFLDKQGQAVGLDTNLANIDLRTPQQRESDAWLDRVHDNMPRFEDKNGNPVTLRTKLSDLNGFDM